MANADPPGAGEDDQRPLEQVAAGAVTALTLAVAFGLLALEVPFFWVAFPVGFGGLLPLAVGLARWYDEEEAGGGRDRSAPADSETEDALEDLRRRYARGEMDEAEFERRVETLLETDSVNRAREYAERAGAERTGEGGTAEDDRERERERDRERERE